MAKFLHLYWVELLGSISWDAPRQTWRLCSRPPSTPRVNRCLDSYKLHRLFLCLAAYLGATLYDAWRTPKYDRVSQHVVIDRALAGTLGVMAQPGVFDQDARLEP